MLLSLISSSLFFSRSIATLVSDVFYYGDTDDEYPRNNKKTSEEWWNSTYFSVDDIRDGNVPLCQLTYHASAMVNNTLYTYGGMSIIGFDEGTKAKDSSKFPLANNITRSLDLSSTFGLYGSQGADLNNSFSLSINPPQMPVLAGSHLWPDGNTLYLVSGSTEYPTPAGSSWNDGPLASANQLWSLDISNSSSNWEITEATYPTGGLLRTYNDAGVWVPELRKGFNIGGIISKTSATAVSDGGRYFANNSLVEFDAATTTWTIRKGYMNSQQTQENLQDAMLFFVPVGEKGILVAFGGSGDTVTEQYWYPQRSFDTINVYDIATSSWYAQNAVGGSSIIARGRSCGVVVSAADKSSHQIVIFGGHDDGKFTFSDVQILTLPSFQWITAFDPNATIFDADEFRAFPGPRAFHNCHLFDGHHLLTYGGQYGEGTLDNAPLNCDKPGIGLFDLNMFKWKDSWDSKDSSQYLVHPNISSVIGGDKSGGATFTKPEAGFDRPELEEIFAKTPSFVPTETGSSSSPSESAASNDESKSVSAGTIAGASIGSVVGVAGIAGAIWMLLRRKRRASTENPYDSGYCGKPELVGRPIVASKFELEGVVDEREIPRELPGELPGEKYR